MSYGEVKFSKNVLETILKESLRIDVTVNKQGNFGLIGNRTYVTVKLVFDNTILSQTKVEL